jgi:3-hydroxyacyl-CoA dehydrogenase/enoyl-CoA hydratase/carnithine racemase
MVVQVIDFSTVSSAKLNPLGAKIRCFLLEQLASAQTNPSVTSIVLTGGDFNFSAGADLSEFSSFDEANQSKIPSLIDVVTAIEASEKPVVAAITGHCLGGGLEVALSCHYRVAHSKSKLGLPEVQVGVIPGAGGTQRLPRLVGLPAACQMILTGKPVNAKKAIQLTLVDVVSDHVVETAKEWAQRGETTPIRRVGQLPPKESPPEAHVILHSASLGFPPQGSEGLHAAVEAMRAVYTTPNLSSGMKVEAEQFIQTLLSEQGQALRHVFFALRSAQKPWQSPPPHTLLKDKVPVAVIGAGTMGSGIALVLLQTGQYKVYLVDVHETALEKGAQLIQQIVKTQTARGKITSSQEQMLLANLYTTQSYDDLRDCQLVVEAAIENMAIKRKIFQQLSSVVPKTAILLSNTSTLDIDQMAAAVDFPQRFAGWHFFSPAHVMKLVEIVVGKQTSKETVALLQALTKRIGKIGVVVGNCDGFCGNRMLKPYSAETVLLITESKNSIADVDKAFLKFGMALGPFQMSDLAGNDVGYNIRKERGWVRTGNTAPNRPDRYTELADVMVAEHGRLGQKTLKGWYDYDSSIGKGRKGLHSPEMETLVQNYRARGATATTEAEMIEQVLYPLVNEGFKCLEEGIARSPSDIDIVYLFGYGFPAWRGGPMYWADHEVTLPVLLSKLQSLHRQHPRTEHFVPSKLLEQCVRLQITAEEYYKREMHLRSGQAKL